MQPCFSWAKKGPRLLSGPCARRLPLPPLARPGGIAVVSPSSSSPQLSGLNSFFRTLPSDRHQGAAATGVARRLGITTIAIVASDSPYANALSLSFETAWQAGGGTVGHSLAFIEGATAQEDPAGTPEAIVAALVKAKRAKPPIDGVFLTTGDVDFMIGFLRAAGNASLNLPIVSGDAAATPAISKGLQDNPRLLQPLTMTRDTPGTAQFQAKFVAAAPKEVRAFGQYAAQAYDAVRAVLQSYDAAAASQNTTDAPSPADIAQQLYKQRFSGATGQVEFDRNGDLVPHDGSYIEVTFDPSTGRLRAGRPLPLPAVDD